MKKTFIVLMCAVLVFSLYGCINMNGMCGEQTVMSTTKPPVIAESITLGYDDEGEPKIITDDDLSELGQYDEIHSLVLANYNGTDLSALKQVKGLQSLKLQTMENLTDISFLTELKELKFLMIYNLSDEFTDISVLSQLTWLEELSLNNIGVDDFTPLHSLVQLKSLDMTSTAMTQSQYDALVSALPDCEIKNVTIYND